MLWVNNAMAHSFLGTVITMMQKLAVTRAMARVAGEERADGSVGRSHVKKFEILLSNKLHAPMLGTSGGTDALILAMKALQIKSGDEVIVPAFTCVATASCVSWINARPVFADIRADDYAVDPGDIEKKITNKTKAIVVVHLFGQPAGCLQEILNVAKSRGVFVIEDAAQAFGAKVKTEETWKDAGTVGDIGCFSFSSTKPLSVPGNAGAITARDARARTMIRQMRLYGAEIPYYNHPVVGIGAKLHEIHAAILLAKLPFYEHWLDHRKNLADRYTRTLSGSGDIILPREEEGTNRIWYRYVIRTRRRDALLSFLRTTFRSAPRLTPTIHYPVPLPRFQIFGSGCAERSFPTAERVATEVLSLPLNDGMSFRDAEKVCDAVKKFFG